MKISRSAFWLWLFLLGVLAILITAFVFEWDAVLRLPWPWLLIFFPPVILWLTKDRKDS